MTRNPIDNSSGTSHFGQSDGVVYDGSMSGLDTYSITRFGNKTASPDAGVTTTDYTETAKMISLWEFSGAGSYSHEINEEDSAAGTSKHVYRDDWWTDESESSWSSNVSAISKCDCVRISLLAHT